MTSKANGKKEIEDNHNSLPNTYAAVDSLLLFRVISNLISNAVKYSSVGDTIEIVSREVESRIYISVKDNGIGIKVKNY